MRSKIPAHQKSSTPAASPSFVQPTERNTDEKIILEKARQRFSDTTSCSLCFAEEVVRHLKHCGRCMKVFYCSKSCQRGHWKAHKPVCDGLVAFRKMLVAINPADAALHTAQERWQRRYFVTLVRMAGCVLLPYLGSIREHLVETHALFVKIRERTPGSGQFDVLLVERRSREQIMSEWLRFVDDDTRRRLGDDVDSKAAKEVETGEPYAGLAWIVVMCEGRLFPLQERCWLSQACVDVVRNQWLPCDWKESLINDINSDTKFYKRPDGTFVKYDQIMDIITIP